MRPFSMPPNIAYHDTARPLIPVVTGNRCRETHREARLLSEGIPRGEPGNQNQKWKSCMCQICIRPERLTPLFSLLDGTETSPYHIDLKDFLVLLRSRSVVSISGFSCAYVPACQGLSRLLRSSICFYFLQEFLSESRRESTQYGQGDVDIAVCR